MVPEVSEGLGGRERGTKPRSPPGVPEVRSNSYIEPSERSPRSGGPVPGVGRGCGSPKKLHRTVG